MLDMKQRFISMGSSGSLHSPESNETIERRHLKSILKKLSADDSICVEDRRSACEKRNFLVNRSRQADLKKLMRAPTVEGYAARHTKLMKSVTFDRETLPSPTEAITVETNLEESVPKVPGLSPTSPTAILTLQLSNLSMIPIASPKKGGKAEKGSECSEGLPVCDVPVCPPEFLEGLEEELKKLLQVRRKNLSGGTDDELREEEGDVPGEDLVQEIGHLVRGQLDGVQGSLRAYLKEFQTELKKRDETIYELRQKMEELQGGRELCETSLRSRGSSPIPAADLKPAAEEPVADSFKYLKKNPFKILEAEENESPDSPDRAEGAAEIQKLGVPEVGAENGSKMCQMQSNSRAPPIQSRRLFFEGGNRSTSFDSGGAEEFELAENESFPGRGGGRTVAGLKLKKELSLDSGSFHGASTRYGTAPEWDHSRKADVKARGTLMNRVAEFRKSLSRSSDFVTVDVDSPDSSDPEDLNSKDWEVQMLVEELSKKEKLNEWASTKLHKMEEMKKLEDDVNALKQVVCEGNLTRFTASELDMLETILEAKDQTISEIASSSCFDIAGEESGRREAADRADARAGGSSFRRKIGQAFSFDFHDIEEKKRRGVGQRKSLRKQKSTTSSYQERQSLDNLLHASCYLKSRVLEDPNRLNKTARTLDKSSSRSSLPLIMSHTLALPKSSSIRKSLPTLSRRDLVTKRPRMNEYPTSSVSSSEEACHEGDLKDGSDCAFDESQLEVESLLEIHGSANRPSGERASDSHGAINNFIRTVGQKVRHAVVGEGAALRGQLPTISRLCEEQMALGEGSDPVPDMGGRQEEGGRARAESFDSGPKAAPPDF